MCDDVANYVLLDFIVGSKIHWKKMFNKCIDDINHMYNHFSYNGLFKFHFINIHRFPKNEQNLFVERKERKDMFWFNNLLKKQIQDWVLYRAYDDFNEDDYIDSETIEASRLAFLNSYYYISEFRLAVLRHNQIH